MEDIIYGGYPTEKFPSEYTKQGQAVLMQRFLDGKDQTIDKPVVKSLSIDKETLQTKNNPTSSSIDVHKLMPLIKSMSQNKSISKIELMKMVLPLLSGNNGDLNELITLMIDKNTHQKDIIDMTFEEDKTKPKIASFKRVEQ